MLDQPGITSQHSSDQSIAHVVIHNRPFVSILSTIERHTLNVYPIVDAIHPSNHIITHINIHNPTIRYMEQKGFSTLSGSFPSHSQMPPVHPSPLHPLNQLIGELPPSSIAEIERYLNSSNYIFNQTSEESNLEDETKWIENILQLIVKTTKSEIDIMINAIKLLNDDLKGSENEKEIIAKTIADFNKPLNTRRYPLNSNPNFPSGIGGNAPLSYLVFDSILFFTILRHLILKDLKKDNINDQKELFKTKLKSEYVKIFEHKCVIVDNEIIKLCHFEKAILYAKTLIDANLTAKMIVNYFIVTGGLMDGTSRKSFVIKERERLFLLNHLLGINSLERVAKILQKKRLSSSSSSSALSNEKTIEPISESSTSLKDENNLKQVETPIETLQEVNEKRIRKRSFKVREDATHLIEEEKKKRQKK